MTLGGYFTSNSVFVSAVLDSEGSTFTDNCVKSNKRRPILSAAQCSPITLVSGNIMRIFAGVPRIGTVKDSEVVEVCRV